VTEGETGYVLIHYLDEAGNQIAPQSVIQFNNTTSEQKQITVQPPSDTTQLRVWAWKNAGTGFFFVDNIVLAPRPNLLANSGFEQGDAAWEDWGNTSILPGNTASGNLALQIGPGQGGRSQTISASPSTTYNLSSWGRVSQAGETGWIIVHHLDAAGNIVLQSFIDFSNTSYEQKQIALQTTANTAQLRVWAWKNAGTGFFYVDDLNLYRQ
jgi:hypothetical protein